jgi:hypothetical protein
MHEHVAALEDQFPSLGNMPAMQHSWLSMSIAPEFAGCPLQWNWKWL